MVESPYHKKSIQKGFWHYLYGRGLSGLAGFLVVILLARYMDVQNYAAYTALSGLIAIAGVLSGLGLERVIARYLPEARLYTSAYQLKNFILRLSLIRLLLILLVCGVLYLFWDNIIKIFPDIKLQIIPVSLFIFILAETFFQHFSSIFQALLEQKNLTRIMAIQWLGRLVLVYMVIHNDGAINLVEAIWIMAIPEAVGVLVFIIVLSLHLNDLHGQTVAKSNWPDWTQVAKLASSNYGFTLLAAPPQGYFMKLFVAAFLPTHLVAAYGFFINIAERVRQYIPLHLFYNLIEPVMIGRYLQDKNFELLSQRCQILYKSNLMMMIPMLLIVIACGKDIVSLLTGGHYQNEYWLLAIVIFQLLVGSHVVLLQLITNSIERSHMLVMASVYALFTMLVFMWAALNINRLAMLFGPLVFSMVNNIYLIYRLNIEGYQYKLIWRSLWPILWASLLSGFIASITSNIAHSLNLQDYVSISITLFLFAVIYLIGLIKFHAVDTQEYKLVKSFLL